MEMVALEFVRLLLANLFFTLVAAEVEVKTTPDTPEVLELPEEVMAVCQITMRLEMDFPEPQTQVEVAEQHQRRLAEETMAAAVDLVFASFAIRQPWHHQHQQ